MKKILILLISILFVIPCVSNALELGKNYTNLSDTLDIAGISKHKKGYTIKKDDVDVILFYGNGCSHCHEFLEFLNDFDKEYNHINLKAFEVWYDTTNQEFLEKVGKELNEEIRGVPFIIIGKKTFVGFGSQTKNEIKDAIKTLYETPIDQRESFFNDNGPIVTTGTTTSTPGTVDMYIFYGDGCSHCAELEEHIKTNLRNDDRVKDIVRITYYETWYDTNNQEFLKALSKELGTEVKGVPFMVIGNQTFSGFGKSMAEDIVDVILEEANNSKYVDVIQKVKKSSKLTPVSSNPEAKLEVTNKYNNNESNTPSSNENKTKEEKKEESFFKKYKGIIIGISLIILGIIIFIVIKHLM